jgi:hypothetical protein
LSATADPDGKEPEKKGIRKLGKALQADSDPGKRPPVQEGGDQDVSEAKTAEHADVDDSE